MSAQLGREVRGRIEVAHRCECGLPDVIATEPRLPDGSPFPTHFYLTCPRATAAVSTLESEGLMVQLAQRLREDPTFASQYAAAHRDYLERRGSWGHIEEIAGISAGGMPDRVKCLHALVAQSLAVGPGVNPVGDEVLELMNERGMWNRSEPCVQPEAARRVVAAIDCGTNSIRLLVAAAEVSGELTDLVREMRIVRLGEGIDTTGVIAPAALERTFAACDEFAQMMSEHGVDAVRFVATSASRDARNRDEFVAGVRERLGVEPEVITGTEEAALSFAGAVSSPQVRAAAEPPRLVVDIGGGSTEFVLGTDAPDAAISVDIGCVRLAERHLGSDPPLAGAVAQVGADADRAIGLAARSVPLEQARSLVGLAGTVTTVAAIALGLPEYDPVAIHGSRISRGQVGEVARTLAAMTLAERLSLPVMHPGRADVIVSGAVILDRIVTAVGLDELVVSEHDILDGIAASAYQRLLASGR